MGHKGHVRISTHIIVVHSTYTIMEKIKTTQCPECGCKEYVNENLVGDGYRMCRKCHQDWWVDVDYRTDINTADFKELQKIKGIGPVFAERIIWHRGFVGRYKDVHELSLVKRIGPKRMARFINLIRV